MEEQKSFEELKAEYHLTTTTESRKKELIKLMQEDLKQRCGEDCDTVECLDGKDYPLDSDNVSELYAINGTLKETKTRKERDEISETTRAEALSKNNYSPSNPYPEK